VCVFFFFVGGGFVCGLNNNLLVLTIPVLRL
jgi:hypothetical protein